MQEDSQPQPHKWFGRLPTRRFSKFTAKQGWVNLHTKIFGGRANLLIVLLFSLVLITISPFFELKTQNIEAVSVQPSFLIEKDYSPPLLPSFQENTLFSISEPLLTKKEEPTPVKEIKVIVTAYSSTPWQTDDTPFITAAGTWVRDGVVANNKHSFGTKVRFPEIYGNKIFVVEDRMHWRNGPYQFDIWMDSYEKAKEFGAKIVKAEILEK